MGLSKQLLLIADKPVIRWCIDTLLAGGVMDIIVVLGPTGREISDVIDDYSLEIVWNKDPESDMAGSVREGLKVLDQKASAVMVFPVDHPLVQVDTIRAIIDSHGDHPDRIIIPVNKGRKGHPVIFPRTVIEELSSLDTLRDIVRKDDERLQLTEVDDEGILLNMNTPEDFREIKVRA